jgi:hypothetical protein
MTRRLSFLASIAFALDAHAAPRESAHYEIPVETRDSAGRLIASASYRIDTSLCSITGVSEESDTVVKFGYVGSLYEMKELQLAAPATDVPEATSVQLSAWFLLNDATFLAVPAADVQWSVRSGPITGVSTAGVATTAAVFQPESAIVDGASAGMTASLNLTVLDTAPDNFGLYANDGIGDAWQVQYFGTENPDGMAASDPDGDGGSNAFEYTAGLVPTDPASVFRLSIAPVPGQPGSKLITFSPRLSGRIYKLLSASAEFTDWQPVSTAIALDVGDQRKVIDFGAAGLTKFYRVEITKP